MQTAKEKKQSVVNTSETSSLLPFKWFNDNFIKANSDKSNLIFNCSESSTAVIDHFSIESNIKEVTFLNNN